MDTALGPILTADETCVAVENTLRAWLPVMLDAMGVRDDDNMSPPKNYEQVPTLDALHDAAFPSVGITSPGFAGPPERDEAGNLRIVWRIFIGAYLRGGTYKETQTNTRNYAAAISTVLIQQATLLGFASGTSLVSEDYEPIDTGARTLGGAVIEVLVSVDDARNDLSAPDGQPPDVLTEPTSVTEVDADVIPEDLP